MKRPHFALPEIYDDSLSYYDVLRKLIKSMHLIADNLNKIPEQIANEEKARLLGDQGLQTNIDNEVQTREQGDTTLQQNINSEATAREQADQEIREGVTNKISELKSDIGLLQNDVAQMVDTWELIEKITVEEEAVIQRSYARQYRKILIIARCDTDKLPKFRLISDYLIWEFFGFNHYQYSFLYLMGEIVIPGVFSDVRTLAGDGGGSPIMYYPIVERMVNYASYFNGFKTDNVCKVGTTIKVYGVSV